MGITINLENTNNGTETGGPVTVNPTIANNIVKEVLITDEFNVANIVSYVNTNGLIVSSFDIIVFKNELDNSHAFFKKGAGTYGTENNIAESDILLVTETSRNIDGGAPDSVYLTTQKCDGGWFEI
jgi:hypothetical protein